MTPKQLPTRRLREHPNLEQLKRQAKELLQAFHTRDAKAIAEVNAQYRNADAATFALHDAQLVVARAYGFDSWPKLKAYVEGVTVKRLGEAVRAGDIGAVRAMLKARPELVHMDTAANDEHRALHYAVLARAPEMVRVLMRHGADARKGIYPHRDATGALTLAKERGYDEIVAIVLEEERAIAGPDADAWTGTLLNCDEDNALAMLARNPELTHGVNRDGWTPLHVAAATRKERIVAWLLEHGADAGPQGPGERTPLDHAVGKRAGNSGSFASVVHMLRERGAAMTARAAVALGDADWLQARHAEGALTNPIEDSGGLLTIAARYERPEILTLLLDLGFDPNERMRIEGLEEPQYSGGMPLWHCARQGKLEMAEMLLQRGADPNMHVYASGSSVYSAYSAGDTAMVNLLKRYGGTVDPITVGLFRETEMAKQMLAAGPRDLPPHEHYAGTTVAEHLLWGAACGGDPEIVRAALGYVDWPRDDPHWYEMLDQPLRSWNRDVEPHDSYVECFRLVLARCDANLWHSRIARTILHDLAALRAHVVPEAAVAFATLLLDAGARLDVRDELLRSTPLGWACRWGRVELVRLFLERGADPIEAGAEPWATPKAWAAKMGNEAVLALLTRASA